MGAPPTALPETTLTVPMQSPSGQDWRRVAEEVAVAFTCRGVTYAVMMATPAALEDFALGFCLTEGIIEGPEDLLGTEPVARPRGIELRLDLVEARVEALWARHRRMVGPMGCGLCGIESLEAALRPVPVVHSSLRLRPAAIAEAVVALSRAQALHRLTHSMHAAGFWHPDEGLLALREDVGRHNALDKLAGALAGARIDMARGAVVLTSRVSVDLVQKAASVGVPLLLALSAPTALAIRTAEASGITLITGIREGVYEVFSHPDRILDGSAAPGQRASAAGAASRRLATHRPCTA